MTSATAAVVAGMGLASPAYGDDLVDIACAGPEFGERTNTVETGTVLGLVTATGDAFSNLLHDESTTRFTYECGNGNIRNVGNTTIEYHLPPLTKRHSVYAKDAQHKRHHGPPPWARAHHKRHHGPPPWARAHHKRHHGPPPWARAHHKRHDGPPPWVRDGYGPRR